MSSNHSGGIGSGSVRSVYPRGWAQRRDDVIVLVLRRHRYVPLYNTSTLDEYYLNVTMLDAASFNSNVRWYWQLFINTIWNLGIDTLLTHSCVRHGWLEEIERKNKCWGLRVVSIFRIDLDGSSIFQLKTKQTKTIPKRIRIYLS